MCRITGASASTGAPGSVSIRAHPGPSSTTRTTQALPPAGSTVSNTDPSCATVLGGSSATPCDSSVRAKPTGSPPAPRSSNRAIASPLRGPCSTRLRGRGDGAGSASRGDGPPLPDVRQRREQRFDLLPQPLEVGRQGEPLAERLERLVGGEARAEGRELVQDPAGLTEVDGPEVEAVDHRGRLQARGEHLRAPRLVIVHPRRPRDVVDRARAAEAPAGRGLEDDRAAARLAAGLEPRVRQLLEPEHVDQQVARALLAQDRRVDLVEALQRELRRHLRGARDERRVRDVDDAQLVLESFGVREAQAVADTRRRHALGTEPVLPELQRGDAVHDPVDHPRTRSPGPRLRVLEERQIGARGGVLVGVEEVVDGRIVLVDRLLDEPQAEHPHVEVDVARSVARDRGDVVDAFELHALTTCSTAFSAVVIAAASMSRCVTARTRFGPTAPIRTPCASRAATSDLASSHSKMTMFVSTSPGWKPSCERPSASTAALAWSSASRSTLWSSAYSAPAATIPAWRSAPPSICL